MFLVLPARSQNTALLGPVMYQSFARPRLGVSYKRIIKIFQRFIFHLPISDYSFSMKIAGVAGWPHKPVIFI